MIRTTFAVLAVTAAVILAPGLAQAGWQSPIVVSGTGSDASQTGIAGGSDGQSLVVWKREVGGVDVIQGTRVQVDGSQGSILTISPAGENATDPVVESRADGSAMVGWINQNGANDVVQTRTVSADGTMGAVTTRSAAGQDAKDVGIALGDDGSAGVGWLRFDGSLWILQMVRVAADGTAGAVQDLSNSSETTDEFDLAAVPPATDGGDSGYRAAWPQGTGTSGNVYSREIAADGTLGDLYVALTSPNTGGDPHDVQIGYDAKDAMSIMWVRHREDQTAADPPVSYFNWAIERIMAAKGVTPSNDSPLFVAALTPVVEGTPYNVDDLDMTVPYGGYPIMAWIHDLNGGGRRVETGRILPDLVSTFQSWANPLSTLGDSLPAVDPPSIAGNTNNTGVAGATVPASGQATWTRFSNSAFDPVTPSGDVVSSDDVGFVVSNSGYSLAAFTAIDGSSVGTARVMPYVDPQMAADPGTINFGRINIGVARSGFVTIRSSGQTPLDVTGISLGGPDASRYAVDAGDCVKLMAAQSNCVFSVRFTPGSTASQTAAITISSDAGPRVINLTGRGANRTTNRITAKPRRRAVGRGRVVKIRVRVSNVGGVTSNKTKVCARLNQRRLRLAGARCRRIGSLAVGASRNLTYRIRVTGRAPRGSRNRISFRAFAGNAVTRMATVTIRRKR